MVNKKSNEDLDFLEESEEAVALEPLEDFDEASAMLEEASSRGGWTLLTQISVLVDYIETQGDNGSFADFLTQKLEDEALEDD